MLHFQGSIKSRLCYCENSYTGAEKDETYNPVDSGLYREIYGEPLEGLEQRLSKSFNFHIKRSQRIVD